jgi:tRNA-splicing endonuclease subunit Sen54
MADNAVDEDSPITSLHNKGDSQDNDPSDELQDFRFLTSLVSGSNQGHKIPKRGEKDFEPHGTKHQESVLEASRMAMHEALDYMRVHPPKSARRAWYFGEEVLDKEEGKADGDIFSEAVRGRGLEMNHVVMVENSKGTHYRTMGKPARGTQEARIWLLPEEALYLIERGNLDLWWPSRPLHAVRGQVAKQEADEEDGGDDGVSMSLQAAYAFLIGNDGEIGKVSLEKYTVYANLKRAGYVVFRATDSSESPSEQKPTLFNWIFGNFFSERPLQHPRNGPLVRPGLYRSYNQIYQQLSIIPRHTPSQQSTSSCNVAKSPFHVAYHVWKPSRIPNFAKSNPGIPDFRVAVITSRSTTIPTLTEMISLLESTPWDPPRTEWSGLGKSYTRLKHGFRNVMLAVVDQGVISYMRIGEGAFGEEKLYEGFDRDGGRGSKTGGNRGGRQRKERAVKDGTH